MSAQLWTIDIKPEIIDSWSSAYTFQPTDLSYVIRSGVNDSCSAGWTLSYEDPELIRFINVGFTDPFGPKRSDFRLKYGNTIIMAGIITQVQLVGSSQKVVCAGSDYLQLLKDRVFPFDYTNMAAMIAGSFPPASVAAYVASNRGSDLVIQDLVNIMNTDTAARMTTGGANREISASFHGSFNPVLAFSVVPGDTSSMFDLISQIAQMDGQIGFDYFMDADRVLQVYAFYYEVPPGRYVPITRDRMMELEWTNNGPLATREIGFGIGSGIVAQSESQANNDRFGLSDNVGQYGDSYRSQTQVQNLADGIGQINRHPQHDVVITVDVDEMVPVTPGGSPFVAERAGMIVNIDTDLFAPFHTIYGSIAFYRTTELAFTVSNQGDVTCRIACEQTYLEDATVGDD